jgi:predicted Zn-dependent protease
MRSSIWWIAVFTLPLLAQDRPANFYNLEKEAALGRQLAAETARHSKPLDSAAARGYVNELGQRLASKIPGPSITYTFAVVASGADNTTHEPLALPGGYIFVPARLFLAARDEAEFAGMLAHSMAHIAARHDTRQATRGQLVNMSTNQNQGAAIPVGLQRFRRETELEADRLAAEAMAAAGFDPTALARYVGRVQNEDAVRAMPGQVYAAGDGFQAVREEVRRLMPEPVERKPPTLRR